MRVGTICYDVHSGLGHLAKSFYDHGVIDQVLIIPHPHYPRYPDWYPEEIRHERDNFEEFLPKIDTLLIFENAFDWRIVRAARERGIWIVIMPMYEYSPFPPPVIPDVVLCPSLLDMQYYREYNCKYLPVPVDIEWRLRKRARVFIHNAGHGGHDYRNGTPQLLEAMKYVKSPIKLVVRGQPEDSKIRNLFQKWQAENNDPRIEVVCKELPGQEDLWSTGDVMIAPERYNGLSLPLQEGWASGMLVMTTDRFPMNTWLPTEPLIPVERYEDYKISIEFKRAVINPKTIAETIDKWYDRDIRPWSVAGAHYGERHSWLALKDEYLKVLSPKTCASC